uniref:NADH-ubiquinone oxidoreductase chain 4L n=1 Tax=Gonatodes albogularis TaxID=460622 RepID=A0A1Y1CCU2_GONAL|nr:NADH dehydrogenase subunit 4L [Gonatodes albogularis]BAX77892.1 NADH dehydrogenase subunit 4L [Gonatodes albogularis]
MAPLQFATSIMFTLGLTGLMLNRHHLVSALLCLESLSLAIFLSLGLNAQLHQVSTYMMQPIVLLALAACEASMGLALLVASSRTYASDHLKNLNLLKC